MEQLISDIHIYLINLALVIFGMASWQGLIWLTGFEIICKKELKKYLVELAKFKSEK